MLCASASLHYTRSDGGSADAAPRDQRLAQLHCAPGAAAARRYPPYARDVESFFEPLGESRSAGVAREDWTVRAFAATGHTAGPWSADLMHAGPPTALVAHVAASVLPVPSLRLGRLCVEILSPLAVGEVSVGARVLRPGSRVCLVESELAVGGRTAMTARCWYIRRGSAAGLPSTRPTPPPDSGEPREIPAGWGRGYLDALEWRWVSGGFESAGDACVWARSRTDLVAGESISPVERVLVLADSASGISSLANPAELLFVNTDLTVHVLREPTGPWLWMRASTRLDDNGSGITSGTIGDQTGDLARTGQLLFVEPQRPMGTAKS